MALKEFNRYSYSNTNKMIMLLTDREPYTYNHGHEPCKTSTDYVSHTLSLLRELDVSIITVGIDIDQTQKEQFFDCIGDDQFYFAATFKLSSYNATSIYASSVAASPATSLRSVLSGLSDSIGDTICSELGSTRNKSTTQSTPKATADIEKPTIIPISNNGLVFGMYYFNLTIIIGCVALLQF